ncbi:MAG: hypothetical protein KDA61_22725, partial [Planctomycetales bacterium]|nr:hypothetical protein [Planctomycetales bacterium]
MSKVRPQTMNVLAAIAWEFAHRSRLGLALLWLAMVGSGVWVRLAFNAAVDAGEDVFASRHLTTTIHLSLLFIATAILAAVVINAWGPPRRRFALPARSLELALWPLLLGAMATFGVIATALLGVNTLTGANLPVLAPAVAAAAYVAWFQAITWATSQSFALQGAAFVVSLATVFKTIVNFEAYHVDFWTDHVWFRLGPWSLTLGIASAVIAACGFSRLRHGASAGKLVESIGTMGGALSRMRRADALPTTTSPAKALRWNLGATHGRAFPLIAIVAGVAAVAMAIWTPARDVQESFAFLVLGAQLATVAAFLI